MSTADSKLTQTLAALGITSAEQVRSPFAELRTRFDADAAAASDEESWKALRDAWLGRKSGVFTLVTDNWLKPATPELKRAVGAALNELRGHVDAQIEARRAEVETGAATAAAAKDRVDLFLPGVIRPVRDARGKVRVHITVPTQNGWKAIALSAGARQELFISTDLGKEELEAALTRAGALVG